MSFPFLDLTKAGFRIDLISKPDAAEQAYPFLLPFSKTESYLFDFAC